MKHILAVLILVLLGGALVGCGLQPVPLHPGEPFAQLEETTISDVSAGLPSFEEEVLAKAPPEFWEQPAEGEAFVLVGPRNSTVRIPRPPVTKKTAFRILWEAQRRQWARISEDFRNRAQQIPDHGVFNDPAWKASLREKHFQILVQEVQRALEVWRRTQAR